MSTRHKLEFEVSEQIHTALEVMSKNDSRTNGNFVSWLIKSEAIARGLLLNRPPRRKAAMHDQEVTTKPNKMNQLTG